MWLVYHRVGIADLEVLWQTMQAFRCEVADLSLFTTRDSVGMIQEKSITPAHETWKFAPTEGRQGENKLAAFIQDHKLSSACLSWAKQCLERSAPFHGLCADAQRTLIARYSFMKQVCDINPIQKRVIFQYCQSVHRCPTGVGQIPCICPKGKYWDSILQRPLHAWELAALQGIGEEEILFFGLQSVPPNLIQDLAGNSFSGNICTAVLLSTLVAWRR